MQATSLSQIPRRVLLELTSSPTPRCTHVCLYDAFPCLSYLFLSALCFSAVTPWAAFVLSTLPDDVMQQSHSPITQNGIPLSELTRVFYF